ncbi:phosphoesterase [Methanocella sp. CWC-04]|uniref:Phosphoesterase n=1 Tax=Methanooceanicella nereidis TaxID=2052831 RepID=A0AAP2RG56_9EURY|nr:DHHA1 domain-containing protein [Methanocella sp. CWC-04]MCD1295985.1 phosphoesterase [Methanocella sp. CWC-04]
MKSIIFTHSDSDGICSGALALAANRDSPVFFTNAVAILSDIEQARGFDRVIICDIAINIPVSKKLKAKIDEISEESEVIYIDHHPLPEGFDAPWLISDVTASASELTFYHFKNDLDPNMSRVALYGAIGDYRDNTDRVCDLVSDWDKRSLYYQAGTLSQGMEVGRRDYDFKRDIVRLLSVNTLPSEIPVLAKNAIISARKENELRVMVERDVIRMKNFSYMLNPNGCMSKAAIYARVYGRTTVGLAAEYREHKDVYDISVRAKCCPVDKPNINLNLIISRLTENYGGSGGGHPLAAGGRVPASAFKEFLLELDSAVGEALGNK